MKKFIIVILLLYIPGLVLAGSGEPEWYWVRPKPTGNDLKSVKFINNSTGFACGNNGDVIRTIDGGLKWSKLSTPVTREVLHRVDATISGKVIVVGEKSTAMISNDFGNSWIEISFTNPEMYLSGVNFIDSETAYIAGFTGELINQSHIFKTTDGGNTWEALLNTPPAAIQTIKFYSKSYGIISGKNATYITTNSGNTWLSQSINYGFLSVGKTITFIDSLNIGITLAGGGAFTRTTNGGQSWTRIELNLPLVGTMGDNPEGHTFSNDSTGFLVSRFGRILKTSNGGLNWSLSETNTNLWDVTALEDNSILAIGYGGTVIRSTDSGNTWNKLMGGYQPLNHLVFVNQSTGFACGNRGSIIKTTDVGETWQDLNSGVTVKLNQLYFINETTGYCVGDTGTFLKTTNAGDTWIVQNSGTNLEIYSVYFHNELNGIIAPMGSLKVTTDGGISWQSQFFFTFARFKNLYFQDENTGIAANGYIYKTSNSGFNWSVVYDNDDYYSNLFFVDNEVAYYLKRLKILKTSNSGNNWTVTQNNLLFNPVNIFFGSKNIGLVSYGLGFSGGMNKTTDGGNSWFDYPTVSGNRNNWISFVNANTGLAVDWRGCIIKTTNEIITDIISTSTEVPEKIQLLQNYPNPFNSETLIKYELPLSSNVKLVINDLLGREIITLVNEKQTDGIHSVKWNAAGFPSGIYLYTLYSNNNFVQTKKLTLLK